MLTCSMPLFPLFTPSLYEAAVCTEINTLTLLYSVLPLQTLTMSAVCSVLLYTNRIEMQQTVFIYMYVYIYIEMLMHKILVSKSQKKITQLRSFLSVLYYSNLFLSILCKIHLLYSPKYVRGEIKLQKNIVFVHTDGKTWVSTM